MNSEQIFYIIIGIVSAQFIFEQWLDYLNHKHVSAVIPKELEGIYNEEQYAKQQNYKKANYSFGLISDVLSFIVMLAMLFLGGFALIHRWVEALSDSVIMQSLLFFAIIGLGSSIISLPFSIYGTFVIEERFGFNKTTPITFVLDLIKSMLLSVAIGGPLMALVIWLYTIAGDSFWLYAWMVISGFTVFMTMFYTSVILPLFNKQTPLEAGELREAIEAFSNKAGFKLDNIFVMDGSKRSTKANAFFSGLGSRKRIVLYDTLINDLSTEEIVAVLAHEVGHYKLKHTLWGTIIGVLQMGIILFVFGLVVGNPLLSQALGVTEPNFHMGLLVFGILYTPVSFLTGIIMSVLSRKNEYAADAFANSFGLGKALINGLKTISSNALSNLTPHRLYVFFHYSHPPLLQRIRAINEK
ncbi:M48 family metallopeptidase [Carboxylicivirga mesophila]|uniref:M48 family metallopeptidase n=1 Tax=Carboxylicivirga mesophila TaxID=1166478 RepID=A0ABS5K8Z5_9BACT|nr:M48 family metallopeptidase [Carboxylicivirga mesophila]MBS2211342.1 M48 family metallopeptidase [Carboxylicivirga mesophila]